MGPSRYCGPNQMAAELARQAAANGNQPITTPDAAMLARRRSKLLPKFRADHRHQPPHTTSLAQHPHRTRCIITIACDWGHTVKSSGRNQGMRVKLIMTEQKEGKTRRRRNHQAKLPTTTPRRTTGTRCEESRSPGCADDSSASRQSHSSSLPQSLPPSAAVRGPSGAHH